MEVFPASGHIRHAHFRFLSAGERRMCAAEFLSGTKIGVT
jgi:hypothetical protein